MKGVKHVLTDKQLRWLMDHFKNTKNSDIVAKLGISETAVHRLARQYGLKKTRQYMKKAQLNAAAKAKKSHIANGTYPPKGYHIPRGEEFRFKPGVTPVQRLGKKKEALRLEKAHESLRRTRKVEKARVLFGLPQKTKLRVKKEPFRKTWLRYYLKKRGYTVNDAEFVAYYDENTRRAVKIEQYPKQMRYYDFKKAE